jgi:hypothetical protein
MQYDLTRPNTGRMIDYYLGGTHNFEIDRQFADQIAKQFPVMREQMIMERARLQSLVQFFYDQGIRAIIDFGSGLPTCRNTHLVAHAIDPNIKVIYCDIDPVTAAYGQEILLGEKNVVFLQGDACAPLSVLDAPEVRALLEDHRRVGFNHLTLGHLLTDEQLRQSWQALYAWAAPDSYLAVSIPSKVWETNAYLLKITESYRRAGIISYYRLPAELETFIPPWKLTQEGIREGALYEIPNGTFTKSVAITYSMMLHKE